MYASHIKGSDFPSVLEAAVVPVSEQLLDRAARIFGTSSAHANSMGLLADRFAGPETRTVTSASEPEPTPHGFYAQMFDLLNRIESNLMTADCHRQILEVGR